jgi:hypothetical protein
MSDPNALDQGLTTFANVLKEIKEGSIDIMRVHPVNGLIMVELLANIGYTIFAIEDDEGMFEIGQWGIAGEISSKKFESKQELMSFIFRQSAVAAGSLLDAKVVKDLFSAFNFGKLLEALK